MRSSTESSVTSADLNMTVLAVMSTGASFHDAISNEESHENGIPLGLDAFDSDLDDASVTSQSQKIDDSPDDASSPHASDHLIFPLVDFDRADNATYDTDTYLDAEYLMDLNGLTAEQGMEIYADNVAKLAERGPATDDAANENNSAMRVTEKHGSIPLLIST